jgi:hypothetical protein
MTLQGSYLSNLTGGPLTNDFTKYAGQCFTKDQQCKLQYGS